MKTKNFLDWAQGHQTVEAYMFTHVPSFTRSFEAVLWKDQKDRLYGSLKLYPPHYDPPPAREEISTKETQGPLAPTVWVLLQEALERYAFWGESSWETEMGRDGTFWRFTGLRNGISKFRESWSPDESEPAHRLGMFFFNLVPPSFCPVMTYEQAAETYRQRPMPPHFPIILVD